MEFGYLDLFFEFSEKTELDEEVHHLDEEVLHPEEALVDLGEEVSVEVEVLESGKHLFTFLLFFL